MTNPSPEASRNGWRPARWLRFLLPTVVLAAWLIAAGFGGATFGKLPSVSHNDQAAFLPASAESTAVIGWQQRFSDAKAIPAIVVLESDAPIPRAELGDYARLGASFGGVAGVQTPPTPGANVIAGPIPSEDGRAVEYIVPIVDQNDLPGVVSDLRAVAERVSPPGVTAYVTGPAGLTADLVDAFGGIDGLLLLVAGGAVLLILLVVYRAVVLPILVLLTAIFALSAAVLVIYVLARWGWIELSGQSQGILSILVIGAATDYAFLLVSRFREARPRASSPWEALGTAWRAALEPIVASGATVIVALLCLLFSDLSSNKSLGPIAAVGIVFALLASLTLLPMLLAVFDRVAFWPFTPKAVADMADADANDPGLRGIPGLWRRVGLAVARRPRAIWMGTLVLLVACALGLAQLRADGVSQADLILSPSQAVAGQEVASRHFPSGLGSPVVIVVDQAKADAVLATVTATPGVESASLDAGNVRPGSGAPPIVRDGKVLIDAVLEAEADSHAAEQVVRTLRAQLPAVDPGVLVGGVTAIALDTTLTAQGDLRKIIPIVLAVILVILMLLLRAVVAPLLLIGTVVVSYAAALGVSALAFNHVFGFPGADASVPLFGFVFLVALGVDYNIFLMTRVREESAHLGTHSGILRGLGMTGSVITSAGVILAATFAALAVIPILFLVQISFIVAFGVLLDTVVVRSLLVPALSYDIGRAIWWPSRLARVPTARDASS